jgi:hypothetical protein
MGIYGDPIIGTITVSELALFQLSPRLQWQARS